MQSQRRRISYHRLAMLTFISEYLLQKNLLFCSFAKVINQLLCFPARYNKDGDHVVYSHHTHKEHRTQRPSIPQNTDHHTRDKSFLCRKQSQLCRVRIGSQSERGGWYDVSPTTPPPRPEQPRKTRELKWKWKQRTTLNGNKKTQIILGAAIKNKNGDVGLENTQIGPD